MESGRRVGGREEGENNSAAETSDRNTVRTFLSGDRNGDRFLLSPKRGPL